MSKTKKTKTPAVAQARAITEIAQSASPKSVVQAKVKTKGKAASARSRAAHLPLEEETTAMAPIPPKIRLEYSQLGARSVAIAGSFNSWQPEQASATGNGGWVKELAIGPGRYEYMFVVDGQWLPDPNAKEFAPNPFGGQNSVIVISK